MSPTEASDGADHRHIVSSFVPQNPPLLSLPGELRNQIYVYVFTSSTYYIRRRRSGCGRTRAGISLANHMSLQPHPRVPLLLTCRQTYCETVGISPSLSTFMFSSLSILPLCNQLPANLRLEIQHVRILLNVTEISERWRFWDVVHLRNPRDLIPNVRSVEYTAEASEVAEQELYRSMHGGLTWMDILEEWFGKTGEVELIPHIV